VRIILLFGLETPVIFLLTGKAGDETPCNNILNIKMYEFVYTFVWMKAI
jgi:hypothetical protein